MKKKFDGSVYSANLWKILATIKKQLLDLRLQDSVLPSHINLLRMPIRLYARDRACEIKLITNWVRDSPK